MASRPCIGWYTTLLVVAVLGSLETTHAFVTPIPSSSTQSYFRQQDPFVLGVDPSSDNQENGDNEDDEIARMKRQAEELRRQIREMEQAMGDRRGTPTETPVAADAPVESSSAEETATPERTLRKKRVLVAGANGRLGSMVCRYLLRNHPQTEVVAAVHVVGENSVTARGYGRLAYEVGAEDGVGTLGTAWSGDDRNASFEWHEGMRDYNLRNLRIVECEFLDPVQCQTVVEGCDAVLWCATDFNGNQPRAVSGFNVAFLFRAVASPTKGRVEVEGVQNMMSALKLELQERSWKNRQPRGIAQGLRGADSSTTQSRITTDDSPVNFVLVSSVPEAFNEFETPFGSFYGIKRQGENMALTEFPSLTSTVLQMGRYDDNFIEENLDICRLTVSDDDISEQDPDTMSQRRLITRRDAARAVVEALTDEETAGKTVQVWTAKRG